jgi:hypothetical protein
VATSNHLSQSCPLYFQRVARGPLKSGGCADPTTPLLFID